MAGWSGLAYLGAVVAEILSAAYVWMHNTLLWVIENDCHTCFIAWSCTTLPILQIVHWQYILRPVHGGPNVELWD
jgi:hypothetical protein